MIFVTALHDEDSELRGFEQGGGFHKPVRSAIALSRIRARRLDAKEVRDSLRVTNRTMVSQMEEGARQLGGPDATAAVREDGLYRRLSAGIAHEINNPIRVSVASNPAPWRAICRICWPLPPCAPTTRAGATPRPFWPMCGPPAAASISTFCGRMSPALSPRRGTGGPGAPDRG